MNHATAQAAPAPDRVEDSANPPGPVVAPPLRAASPALTPRAAAERLADWGFLARADLPDGPGDAYLTVAIRDRPTFRHYDPESVEFWITAGAPGRERGSRIKITRSTRLPVDRSFSWGLIRIVDRLGVSNEYVAFGGRLAAEEVDGMTVCVFSSPAPILRRGGHSQIADAGCFDLAAWFGRMMVAVDYTPGFESQIAAASPLGRYCAFVADYMSRRQGRPELQARDHRLWQVLRKEAIRLERDRPEAWTEGRAILVAGGLAEEVEPAAG